jgi:hypothetical protein
LKVPVKLIGLGAKVFDNVAESSRRYQPMVSGGDSIEGCMQNFSSFIVQTIGLDDPIVAHQLEY